MPVEAGSTVAVGSVAAGLTAVVFAAGVDSAAELVSAAAAGFAEVRSAGDFVVAIAFAVAFVVTAFAVAEAGADGVGEGEVGIGTIGGGASVLAGTGLMDIGPDTRIRMDMGTTPGGLRPTTVFLLMIPTMILTILTTTRHPHTQIGLTRIAIGTAGTRIRHRRALQ
jgi:hypothetical protein